MKILYFDTETTGTDPKLNEITQFAAIIEVNGEVVEEVNWRCRPTRLDHIDPQALETTGVGLEELTTFQPPQQMLADIKKLLCKYIPKFTKANDKFYPAGHNVQFDLDFLDAFFKQHGTDDDVKWGITSYQNWRALDTRVFANFLMVNRQLNVPNVKLATLCNFFDIEIKAHDALSDIRATRLLNQKMRSFITEIPF